jgi:hypothetical protein
LGNLISCPIQEELPELGHSTWGDFSVNKPHSSISRPKVGGGTQILEKSKLVFNRKG